MRLVGEARRRQKQAPSGRNRALLVDEPPPHLTVQCVRAQTDKVEQAASDVGGVPPRHRLAGVVEQEGCFAQVLGQGVGEPRRDSRTTWTVTDTIAP